MNKKIKYIHYGHKEFDKNKFEPIRNESCFVKPMGGLWASRINAKYGWKDWNNVEHFRECIQENSFTFCIKDKAKILEIKNTKDLTSLPKTNPEWLTSFICLDFDKLKEKYDAIELFLSEDRKLYWDLYGWDCDSILIMNPDIVEVIENEK